MFSEVLSLRSNINDKYKPKEIEMLLDLTGKYAAKNYDLVIHVRNADSKSFNEFSVEFYEKYNIAYRFYDCSDIRDTLENIIREFEIPAALLIESAIYEAVRLVTFKN